MNLKTWWNSKKFESSGRLVFFGTKFTNYSFYTNNYLVCFHYILQTLSQVVSLQYLSLFQGSQLSCTLIGSIFRHSHERVVSVMTDLSQTFLGCLVSVKFLLESSLCSRYWVFEGERRNFEDAHACSPFIAHSITTDQMLMLTEINMNFLYLPKFLEALISFIMWLQQYMHHDWLLKKISYNDLDLLASVCVQGRYNLCL